MTGWAATNTLREAFGLGTEPECAPGECKECDEIRAVLALVETALGAAEKTVKKYTHNLGEPDEWRAWNNQDGDKWPDLVRLAAALRAVREGASRGCAACEGDPEAHGLHVCGRDGAS